MIIRRLVVAFSVAAALALLFTVITPFRAAAVQALAIVTCASASPCTGGNNSSTGPGVQGTSAKGIGVFGRGREGVEGDDVGGNSDALFAKGHGGNLIRANNASGKDIFLLRNTGFASFAGSVGVQSLDAENSFGLGVHAFGVNAGVEGGLLAPCVSECAGVEGISAAANETAVYANGQRGGGFLFIGNNSAGHAFLVDNAGNVHAHSFTPDLAASQAASNGSRLTTYSTENRRPTMEDYGEATLTGGQAYVRLDSSFASGIDRSHPYLVFITPQGPVSGMLYVAQKTSSGFAVRETGAARSSVAFDYRIVARPFAKPMTSSSVSPVTKQVPIH